MRSGGIIVQRIVLSLFLLTLIGPPVTGCGIGTSPSAQAGTLPQPTREYIERFVTCMATPPPIEAIDWPNVDKLGNVLMHASTAERFKAAYGILARYVSEQYRRCRELAEAKGTQSVTTEVERAPGDL